MGYAQQVLGTQYTERETTTQGPLQAKLQYRWTIIRIIVHIRASTTQPQIIIIFAASFRLSVVFIFIQASVVLYFLWFRYFDTILMSFFLFQHSVAQLVLKSWLYTCHLGEKNLDSLLRNACSGFLVFSVMNIRASSLRLLFVCHVFTMLIVSLLMLATLSSFYFFGAITTYAYSLPRRVRRFSISENLNTTASQILPAISNKILMRAYIS